MDNVFNHIDTICTMLITMAVIIFSYLRSRNSKKNSLVIHNAIEKISKHIKMLEYEEFEAQKRHVNEKCDFLYSLFFNSYCKNMQLSLDSYEAKMFKLIILERARALTDDILIDACKINHFYKKSQKDWIRYKYNKKLYILSKVSELIVNIWDEDLLKIDYNGMNNKCALTIQNIYFGEF